MKALLAFAWHVAFRSIAAHRLQQLRALLEVQLPQLEVPGASEGAGRWTFGVSCSNLCLVQPWMFFQRFSLGLPSSQRSAPTGILPSEGNGF